MTVLQAIKQLCEQIPGYTFAFEEAKMFNIDADNTLFPCIFFEEYREGNYRVKYYFEKITRVQLYFCKLCQADNTADEREQLREQIEVEAVKPFIKLFNTNAQLFANVLEWKFYTPPPRFDANEVSVMLQFDAKLIACNN